MTKTKNPASPKCKLGKKPTVKAGTSKAAAEARRKLFVEAYLSNGGNATEAAKTAGFSSKTARFQTSRLLTDVNIQTAIAARAEAVADKYSLNAEMVAKSIVQEINFNPKKLYNDDGTLKAITELDDDVASCLAGVEFAQLGSPDAPVFVRKYKWAAKAPAREQAMKHLGMFEKDNEQKVGVLAGLPPDVLRAIADRLKAVKNAGGSKLA